MKRVLPVFAALLMTGNVVNAQSGPGNTFPHDAAEAFEQSLLGKQLFSIAPPADEEVSPLAQAWIGTKATLSASLDVEISFTHDSQGKELDAPITIGIQYEREREGARAYVVRSNLLERPLKGSWNPISQKSPPRRRHRFYRPAGKGRGLFILQPGVEDQHAAYGLELCVHNPPSVDAYKKRRTDTPTPTAPLPVPSSALFSAEASGEGSFVSDVHEGFAEIRITTNDAVTPSRPDADTVIRFAPHVSMRYVPSGELVRASFPSSRELVGAIEITATYHNVAGHKRRESFTERMLLRFHEPSEDLLRFMASHEEAPPLTGGVGCLSAINVVEKGLAFAKEEFRYKKQSDETPASRPSL
jgi:hypothetical protein